MISSKLSTEASTTLCECALHFHVKNKSIYCFFYSNFMRENTRISSLTNLESLLTLRDTVSLESNFCTHCLN